MADAALEWVWEALSVEWLEPWSEWGSRSMEAKRYEGRVKDGGILVSVHCEVRKKFRVRRTF